LTNAHCFSSLPVEGKIRLLDVGSCFNAFLEFPEIQAVGIDISPATEVRKAVNIELRTYQKWFSQTCSFHKGVIPKTLYLFSKCMPV